MAFDPSYYLLERYAGERARRARAMGAYYTLKPLLPRRLQLAIRRAYARRQARSTFPAWPIEPILVRHWEEQVRARLRSTGRERVPLVNPWPDGKRFAAILTHDVEGTPGVENIPRVLEIERRHGLVSSWNFVAEWYPIPQHVFDELRGAGCEIGLHGIRHDGRLFADRASFDGDLPAIHRYLREWGAVGFRSPATHRNSDWMPELGCLYDTSFPDTDPFEPQAGGCCSIFPFFIEDLVELPITLVQDHTMWEILRRRSIELWTDKSDWIIRHHGLINVIVHPDYVVTSERLELYDRFLGFLRRRLDLDGGWHALPRDVAQWWRERSTLRCETAHQHARIVGEHVGELGNRATIAYASERDGRVVIDADD